MFSLIDLFAHIGQALQTTGSLFKDMLWFRIFLVVGISFEMIYQFEKEKEPLWSLIIWSFLFVLINLVQIGILLYDRFRLKMSMREKRLYALVFSHMDKFNFKKLVSIADWSNKEAGFQLVKKDIFLPELLLIYQGSAVVKIGDKEVATLRNGQFIGEMSFLTDKLTTADVVADSNMILVSWKKEKLKQLLKKEPEIASELQRIFNTDLIGKLVKQTN